MGFIERLTAQNSTRKKEAQRGTTDSEERVKDIDNLIYILYLFHRHFIYR